MEKEFEVKIDIERQRYKEKENENKLKIKELVKRVESEKDKRLMDLTNQTELKKKVGSTKLIRVSNIFYRT